MIIEKNDKRGYGSNVGGKANMSSLRKKILLAADRESLPNLASPFSDSRKFELTVTDNGLEAHKIIEALQPNLAFMDIHLPVMNGDANCFSVKRNYSCPKTHIILLAPAWHFELIERCQRALCDAILMKPVESDKVSAIADKFLYDEKRFNPRFMVQLAVVYALEQKVMVDYSVNISTGGIFIETDNLLPVGTPLTVEFTLPVSDRRITCMSRVVRTNEAGDRITAPFPSGMGIQFLDLSLDDLRAIQDFLSTYGFVPIW